jgi:hypothetical protein
MRGRLTQSSTAGKPHRDFGDAALAKQAATTKSGYDKIDADPTPQHRLPRTNGLVCHDGWCIAPKSEDGNEQASLLCIACGGSFLGFVSR